VAVLALVQQAVPLAAVVFCLVLPDHAVPVQRAWLVQPGPLSAQDLAAVVAQGAG
jgi:hypothetical protein